MHLFHIPKYSIQHRNVHISVLNGALRDVEQVHSGISELGHIYIGEVVSGMYRQISNISRTLVGNKIVDHSDVVGASPVGAAPTTSSFSTPLLASMD